MPQPRQVPEPRNPLDRRDDRADDSIAAWLSRILGAPWVDKSIAFVALSPFAYAIWQVAHPGNLDIPKLGLLLQLAVMVLTMAFRRPPVRITANPFFWLLAFVATYWQFLCENFYEAGEPLVADLLSSSVSFVALGISVWARLSLGRNIGFVPAERQIVTTGAYAYVRHPIYSGIFVGVLATELYDFSWRNLAIDSLWCALWIMKTFIEERFLRQNPEYARYMTKVRWRWFPGIA